MTTTNTYVPPRFVDGCRITGREVRLHEMGLRDHMGRRIDYETTIEGIGDVENGRPTAPRTWRVWGRQLRDGKAVGRACSPLHVYSVREARTVARSLFHKHRRYVERHVAKYHLRTIASEEDLHDLAQREGL